jgi:hypothetical protein
VRQVAFTASGEQAILKFEQTAAGDNTLLLDNVVVLPGGAVDNHPKLTVSAATGGLVTLSWPVSATGFNLFAAGTLNTAYTAVLDPVVVNGANNTVTVQASDAAKFYQLKK